MAEVAPWDSDAPTASAEVAPWDSASPDATDDTYGGGEEAGVPAGSATSAQGFSALGRNLASLPQAAISMVRGGAAPLYGRIASAVSGDPGAGQAVSSAVAGQGPDSDTLGGQLLQVPGAIAKSVNEAPTSVGLPKISDVASSAVDSMANNPKAPGLVPQSEWDKYTPAQRRERMLSGVGWGADVFNAAVSILPVAGAAARGLGALDMAGAETSTIEGFGQPRPEAPAKLTPGPVTADQLRAEPARLPTKAQEPPTAAAPASGGAPATAAPAAAPIEPPAPKFTPPEQEGSAHGPLPADAQAARAKSLNDLNQDSGGALPEHRVSALTGDYAETGNDYQYAKGEDAGGQKIKATINQENTALKTASEKTTDPALTGGTAEGTGRPALAERGTVINNALQVTGDWFDNAIKAQYAQADAAAGNVPMTKFDNLNQLLNDHSQFTGTEGRQLHSDISQVADQFGMRGQDGFWKPTTVQTAERFRQWLGEQYSPRTGRIIARAKDALDADVGAHGGQGLYDAGRALRFQRDQMLEGPNGIRQVMSEDKYGNRGTEVADIPDKIANMGESQFNHVVNVLHDSAKLGNGELAEGSANALNEIRGHMAARLHEAGTKNPDGSWNARSYYNTLNKYSLKLPKVFSPEGIDRFKTLNDAGNTLRMDKSYPGAGAQIQKLGGVGAIMRDRIAHTVEGAVTGALGPLGGAGMELLGGGKAIRGGINRVLGGGTEAKRAATLNARVQPLGAKLPGQRGAVGHLNPPGVVHDYEPSTGHHEVQSPNGVTHANDAPNGKDIVVDNTVTDAAGRNSGEGTLRMKKLADAAADRGGKLLSDNSISPHQVPVYSSLQRMGYKVTKNPEATKTMGIVDERNPKELAPGYIADKGDHVFSVERPSITGSPQAGATSETPLGLRPGFRRQAGAVGNLGGNPYDSAPVAKDVWGNERNVKDRTGTDRAAPAGSPYDWGGTRASNPRELSPLGQRAFGGKQRGAVGILNKAEEAGEPDTRYHTLDAAHWAQAQKQGYLDSSQYAGKKIWTSTHPSDYYNAEAGGKADVLNPGQVEVAIKGGQHKLPPGRTPDDTNDRVMTGRVPLSQVSEVRRGAVGNLNRVKAADETPLAGAPEGDRPNGIARASAQAYQRQHGLGTQLEDYRYVQPEAAKAVADAYDKMKHNPSDPKVAAAYDAFKKETLEQYKHIQKTAGTKFTLDKDYPYKQPREAQEDVRENNHMSVYPTSEGFGTEGAAPTDHPMMEKSPVKMGGQPATYNDLFRAVHDYYGHVAEGNGFRANGEYNAWRAHREMYSDAARPAMDSETLGQNSWVNSGPHAEANRGASGANTVYADQKAGLLPKSVVDKAAGGLSAEESAQSPQFKAAAAHLTPEEREDLTGRAPAHRAAAIKSMLDTFHGSTPVEGVSAMALAGQAKKGWYRDAAKSINGVFGPDSPRFTALLAAMSPQTSVEMNFHNALHTYVNWDKAGRPTDPAAIKKIMEDSSLKNPDSNSESNVMDAWHQNGVRALTSADPEHEKFQLSGPKVDSFYKNLRGHTHEVTNDSWNAIATNIDQKLFSGAYRKVAGDIFGRMGFKSPTYMGVSAKVRAAAMQLQHLTGEKWTPAEVQETMWSFVKTAFEHAKATGKSIPELLKSGELNDQLIRGTSDFHSLFGAPEHKGFLDDSRFGEAAQRVASQPHAEPTAPSQASAAAAKGLRPQLEAEGERLEGARQARLANRKARIGNIQVPF